MVYSAKSSWWRPGKFPSSENKSISLIIEWNICHQGSSFPLTSLQVKRCQFDTTCKAARYLDWKLALLFPTDTRSHMKVRTDGGKSGNVCFYLDTFTLRNERNHLSSASWYCSSFHMVSSSAEKESSFFLLFCFSPNKLVPPLGGKLSEPHPSSAVFCHPWEDVMSNQGGSSAVTCSAAWNSLAAL